MQAFVQLGEAMERGDVREPRKLLRTILRGRLTDHIRNGYRQPTVPLTEQIEQGLVGGFQDHDSVAFSADFDAALRGLPEEERDVYILTELRGLSQTESARVLAVSQQTVSRRAQAAHILIQKELSE